jgi:hypothetical protein
MTSLVRREREAKHLTAGKSRASDCRKEDDRSITKMLVAVTLIFLMSELPYGMYVVTWDFALQEHHLSAELIAIRQLHYKIALFGQICNHSLNFYSYCLSCGKFRRNFFDLIKSIFCFNAFCSIAVARIRMAYITMKQL